MRVQLHFLRVRYHSFGEMVRRFWAIQLLKPCLNINDRCRSLASTFLVTKIMGFSMIALFLFYTSTQLFKCERCLGAQSTGRRGCVGKNVYFSRIFDPELRHVVRWRQKKSCLLWARRGYNVQREANAFGVILLNTFQSERDYRTYPKVN